MSNEYAEQMKKKNKTIIRDFYSGVAKAIEEHALTYSGWLTFVKKLSDDEISSLFEDAKRNDKLQKEYELWLNEARQEEK